MTLATRCTGCGTIFRVGAAQLAAAEGWVRCGRCGEVFSADETLTDLGGQRRDAPIVRAEPAPPLAAAKMPTPSLADEGPEGQSQRSPTDGPEAPSPAWSTVADRRQEHPALAGGSSGPGFPATAASPDSGGAAASAAPGADHVLTAAEPGAGASSMSSEVLPRFVWESERLTPPAMGTSRRILWGSLAAAGCIALALQTAILFRDELAARWAGLEPGLQALCAAAGCSVQPPRQLQALRVESSELTQVSGTLYQLQIVVRNRAPHALLWPAVDLVITDAAGQVMARRVLEAGQLATTGQTIAARQEAVLKARLSTGERAASGFTIELFYP